MAVAGEASAALARAPQGALGRGRGWGGGGVGEVEVEKGGYVDGGGAGGAGEEAGVTGQAGGAE